MIKRTLAAALALAAALPSAAEASVTIHSITGNPGFETGRIIYTPGGIGGPGGPTTQYLRIGRIGMSGVDNDTFANVSFDTYCIDIFHYVQNGSFELQAFSLSDPVKQGQLARLLTHTAGFIAGAQNPGQAMQTSAAIQMAVWEIVNESGTSGYSLGSGLFQVATDWGSVVPSARGLAQSYLDGLGGWTGNPNFKVRMMTAINPVANQRQVFLAAVPEPSAWALLILGFGAIGSAMRKRPRQRTSLAYA